MNQYWWPGWSGGDKTPLVPQTMMGINLGRKFQKVLYNPGTIRKNVLTDYYFWSLEQLKTSLPFICEGPQKNIGCTCEEKPYLGNANRTVSGIGVPCVPWKNHFVSNILSQEELETLKLDEHDDAFNHCRNPDGDSIPWCIVENGEFDYCDIPECDAAICKSGKILGTFLGLLILF